ncbi:hypothetical protein D3C81_1945590 [compost metagenome]
MLLLLIRTPLHDSGSIPSVFGESAGLIIDTLSTVTLLHSIGLTVQLGELSSITSLIVTRLQRSKLISFGRGYASSSRRLRNTSHHGPPLPSSVPLPVMEMLTRSLP